MITKTLKLGSHGPQVREWQTFLRGLDRPIHVDGDFGPDTEKHTKWFQKYNGPYGGLSLKPDGVVGPKTLSEARIAFGLARPEQSEDLRPLTPYKRQKIFGEIKWTHTPTKSNPEKIEITNGWARKNIVRVRVPQLIASRGGRDSKVSIHRLIAVQFVELWAAWEREELLDHVLKWSGSYNPRLIRGSQKTLSNHAFGTAFDINPHQNRLGTVPASRLDDGCVRDLVPIAEEHGFYWGGHFSKRPDGMHFEAAVVK